MQAGGPPDETGSKERGFFRPLVWLESKEKGETVYCQPMKPVLEAGEIQNDTIGLDMACLLA